MENATSQNEELMALKSIYDSKDLIIDQETPPCGRFIVNVQLPKPFYVACETLSNDDLVRFEIDYLPPINLCFEFPETYPSDSCPAFLLSCNWLRREELSKLCRKLDSIWAEGYGEVILFSWINFLQEETLRFLGIGDVLDVTDLCYRRHLYKPANIVDAKRLNSTANEFNKMGICNKALTDENDSREAFDMNKLENCCADNADDHCKALNTIKPSITGGNSCIDRRAILDVCGRGLLTSLKEYNLYMQQEVFKNTWLTCQVCFITKKGVDFQTFNNCTHNFCRDCLKSYFEIQIKDGNVHSLHCPEEGCSSQADGTLVKSVVGSELFEKYDTILLSRTLEGMNDIAYCPRRQCQTPLIIDIGSRIGTCPMCHFVFCMFCQRAYHGIAPCNFKDVEKKEIYSKYIEGSAQEKEELERRFGRRELKFLVENVQSEAWLETNSKKCPHCDACIEKTDGCNKMTCYRCGKYFCWLCGVLLKSSNPYSHFSDITSRCYNQLFPDNYDFAMPGEYLDI